MALMQEVCGDGQIELRDNVKTGMEVDKIYDEQAWDAKGSCNFTALVISLLDFG